MAVYGGVIEPILVAKMLEIDHKGIEKAFGTFEEMISQLLNKLGDKPFLLGDQLTIADLIMASPFQFAPHFMPNVLDFKEWVARVSAATDTEALSIFETKAIQKLAPAA
jgi:glutathione S-transferase